MSTVTLYNSLKYGEVLESTLPQWAKEDKVNILANSAFIFQNVYINPINNKICNRPVLQVIDVYEKTDPIYIDKKPKRLYSQDEYNEYYIDNGKILVYSKTNSAHSIWTTNGNFLFFLTDNTIVISRENDNNEEELTIEEFTTDPTKEIKDSFDVVVCVHPLNCVMTSEQLEKIREIYVSVCGVSIGCDIHADSGRGIIKYDTYEDIKCVGWIQSGSTPYFKIHTRYPTKVEFESLKTTIVMED